MIIADSEPISVAPKIAVDEANCIRAAQGP